MPTFTHQLGFGYYPVAVHVYPTVMYFFEKVFGIYPNVGRLGFAKVFEVAFGSTVIHLDVLLAFFSASFGRVVVYWHTQNAMTKLVPVRACINHVQVPYLVYRVGG